MEQNIQNKFHCSESGNKYISIQIQFHTGIERNHNQE